MTLPVSLEQKILSLIINELGSTVGENAVIDMANEPDLLEKLSLTIEDVRILLTSQQPRSAENTPDSSAEATPTAVEPTTGEEQQDSLQSTESKPAPNQSVINDEALIVTPVIWKLMPYHRFDPPETPSGSAVNVDALRPGQVPSAQLCEEKPQRPLPAPAARAFIANARAGEDFCSAITLSLDNGRPAKVYEVLLPQELGLTFDVGPQTVSGIPMVSGDFEIKIRWSCESYSKGETSVLFVVNPDPRSLWKIIEPSQDAVYPKPHIDYNGIFKPGVRIAAASRRGRSHEHAGSFRDDDFYINHSDESGWSVMLVADGAGSASNSREGSRIATTTAGGYLFDQLKGEKGLEIKELILAWGTEQQKATINTMLHHFKQAATLAVNSIQNEAIRSEQKVKSFSTTLLATVSFRHGEELFAASFWLGDGAIAAFSPSGKVRVLGNPDSGEYAGQTRFLDKDIIDAPAFTGRISIGKWSDVSHLILMTDGVSDPRFETDNGLKSDEKWSALVADLSASLSDEQNAPALLAEWLNFFSPGNHDDRTIVVSW